MNRVRRAAGLFTVLLLTACQGSMTSGPTLPFTPPPGGNPASGEAPQPNQTPASVTPETLSYAFAAAPDGFACPNGNGYGCLLRFNVPAQPSGSAAKQKQSAARTPAPSASPLSPLENAVSNPSPQPSASAKPSGPTIALTMTALPTDAPKMVITTKAPIATTALVRVLLVPSDDFSLDGAALAQFTLPAAEIKDRGFAVQVFKETVHGKKRTTEPVITIAHSSLDGNTLSFRFTPPKLTIPKDQHYLVILYGDARPATPVPPPTQPPAIPGYPTPNPVLTPPPTRY